MPGFFQTGIIVSVCAALWTSEVSTAAAETMGAAELLATIPGATLTGISNEDFETRWVQTYEKKGKSGSGTGLFGASQYTSQWFVRHDLWCEDWGHRSRCWRIERVDDDTLQPYIGRQKMPNVWTILRHAGDGENAFKNR